MTTATPEAPAPDSATPTCPPWCQTLHADPEAEDHIRMVDAVHRKPHLESIAVEIEHAAEGSDPLIVLSLFTQQKKPRAMCAGLSLDQARHAHTALGEALSLASGQP
jgi:hypothetical protein